VTSNREALARRFLHVNVNITDADATIAFYEQVTGLRLVMRSDVTPTDGTVLGIKRDVISETIFMYDHRGPRSSAALEFARWVDPPSHGSLYANPQLPGLHAVIHEVASLDAAKAAVLANGGSVVGRSSHSILVDAPRETLVARDPDGVFVELTTSYSTADHGTALGLRATCTDLDASVAWYEAIGFDIVSPAQDAKLPGVLFGLDGMVDVRVARLSLAEDDPAYQLCLVSWPGEPSRERAYQRANHLGIFRCALRVEDSAASQQALDAAGVQYEGPFHVDIPGTKAADLVILILRDPDGIMMEHVQRPGSFFKKKRVTP
jgi:catechol 2,3-dioxygenase-like lactoylglutathione lyase family enzyme